MIRKSDIIWLIADDARAASYQSMSGYRSGLISIIQSGAVTPDVINNDSAAGEIKWPTACRERVWMAGLGEHGMIDLGHLWTRDTGEVAAILIGPPDTPEAITLAFPCQSWAARVFNALVEEQGPVDQPEQFTWPLLEKPALVDGVQFSKGVSSGHVVMIAQRKYQYAAETDPEEEQRRAKAFREFVAQIHKGVDPEDRLADYCPACAGSGVREEEPGVYVVGTQEQVEQEPVSIREARVISYRPGMGEVTFRVAGGVPAFMDIGQTIYVSSAPPAAPDVSGLVEESVRLLMQAFDALESMTDSDIDDFEDEEEEAEAVPAQYACRKIMRVIDALSAHLEQQHASH